MITGVLLVLAVLGCLLTFAGICVGIAVLADDPEQTRLH